MPTWAQVAATLAKVEATWLFGGCPEAAVAPTGTRFATPEAPGMVSEAQDAATRPQVVPTWLQFATTEARVAMTWAKVEASETRRGTANRDAGHDLRPGLRMDGRRHEEAPSGRRDHADRSTQADLGLPQLGSTPLQTPL